MHQILLSTPSGGARSPLILTYILIIDLEPALWNSGKAYEISLLFFPYKQETGDMEKLLYPGGLCRVLL